MSTLMDLIGQQLKNTDLSAIGSQLGLSTAATQSAIAHSLPAMINSLATHAASSPEAADAVHASLDSTAGNAPPTPAAQATAVAPAPTVAEHQAANVDDATLQHIATASGLDVSQLQNLLPMLAPLVTGALGQAKQSQGLSASGLTGLLKKACTHIEEGAGGAVSFAKSHPEDMKSGLVGAGVALAGQFMLGKLFGK